MVFLFFKNQFMVACVSLAYFTYQNIALDNKILTEGSEKGREKAVEGQTCHMMIYIQDKAGNCKTETQTMALPQNNRQ